MPAPFGEDSNNSDNSYISLDLAGSVPVFKDPNPDPRKRGRPTEDEALLTDMGRHIRMKITTQLKAAGMSRSSESRKKSKTYGQQCNNNKI